MCARASAWGLPVLLCLLHREQDIVDGGMTLLLHVLLCQWGPQRTWKHEVFGPSVYSLGVRLLCRLPLDEGHCPVGDNVHHVGDATLHELRVPLTHGVGVQVVNVIPAEVLRDVHVVQLLCLSGRHLFSGFLRHCANRRLHLFSLSTPWLAHCPYWATCAAKQGGLRPGTVDGRALV